MESINEELARRVSLWTWRTGAKSSAPLEISDLICKLQRKCSINKTKSYHRCKARQLQNLSTAMMVVGLRDAADTGVGFVCVLA